MRNDEWNDPDIGLTILEKQNIRWFDKYLHFWQRKNVKDVYLTQYGYSQLIVVVLNDGTVGEGYLPSEEESRIGNALLNAYYEAVGKIKKTDFEKYLKPTLKTKR